MYSKPYTTILQTPCNLQLLGGASHFWGGLCPRPPASEIHNWVYPSPSEHPRSAPQFIIIILGVLAIWTSPKCYLSIFDVNCLPEFKFVLYSTERYAKAIALNAPMFNLSMNLHSLQLPSS